MATQDQGRAHAVLAPSSAHIWTLCPGSIEASKGITKDAGQPAAEGTVFHSIVSQCLEFGFQPDDFLGEKQVVDGFEIEVDEDMVYYAQDGLDRLGDILPDEYHIETRVSLAPWLPDQFGTTDVAWVEGDTLTVWDWKYGRTPVSPIKNRQLMLYALGVYEQVYRKDPAITKFRLIIEQPRHYAGGGEWICSYDDLMLFAISVAKIAKQALSPGAPRIAGETQCVYCPARLTCGEFAAFNLALMGMKFEDLDGEGPLTMPKDIDPARRSKIIASSKMIEKWLEDLHASALDDAVKGRECPGFKAVEGKAGRRKWLDPEGAADELRTIFKENLIDADVEITKPITPAAAIKVVGKKLEATITPLTERADPKPILVPQQDARPALTALVEKFDDETEL